MSPEDRASCLQYLEGDVLGLKELSERLNRSCFENFNVNLYKFLSTSQLTYAVWVNFLYTESKNPIFLQTPEHEKFFRESIYGGRTYKYKHRFQSTQREAYIKGELSFEEIDDYLIDADVNSLYPAAMKNEFPIGIPTRLKPNATTVRHFNDMIQEQRKCPKVGIYRVENISPTRISLMVFFLEERKAG